MVNTGSTGELDHQELFIKGNSIKSPPKAQRKQQVNPTRAEKTGLWATRSTVIIFIIILIKASFLVIPIILLREKKKKDTRAKLKSYRLEVS